MTFIYVTTYGKFALCEPKNALKCQTPDDWEIYENE